MGHNKVTLMNMLESLQEFVTVVENMQEGCCHGTITAQIYIDEFKRPWTHTLFAGMQHRLTHIITGQHTNPY